MNGFVSVARGPRMSKSVVNASALLVLLHREPGSDQVEKAMAEGAWVTTVNLSEVVADRR